MSPLDLLLDQIVSSDARRISAASFQMAASILENTSESNHHQNHQNHHQQSIQKWLSKLASTYLNPATSASSLDTQWAAVLLIQLTFTVYPLHHDLSQPTSSLCLQGLLRAVKLQSSSSSDSSPSQMSFPLLQDQIETIALIMTQVQKCKDNKTITSVVFPALVAWIQNLLAQKNELEMIQFLPMIHLLLTNFPNALRPVSDAVVEFCNKTLDSCLGNSQISDGKAETTNFASYTFSYPASPLSQSQLSSISNTMLTAAAMKRGFDATIISKTIKSFTNRADAVLDLFVNDEWLALQTDSQIGSLAASFSRVMTIVADCLIWASKFHSSVCVNDFKFILSKFAKAMDNMKSGKCVAWQLVIPSMGVALNNSIIAMMECLDLHFSKIASFVLGITLKSLSHSRGKWLWRLTSFELLCRMCDHVVLNKQQCSTIIVHITEDMDSLFISRAEKGGIDLQSQQDVSLDATTGTITDNFNVTEKMVLLAEYSLKLLNYLLVSSSDHDGILSSSLFSMIVSINLGTPRLCRLFAAHPALLILSLRTLHACVLVQPANRTVLGVALKVFGAHLQSRDSAIKHEARHLLALCEPIMHPARPQADNVTPTTAVTSSTTPASQTNNHIQLNHQSFFGIGSSGNPSISSSSMFANGGVKPAHNVAAAPVVQLPVKATATIAPVAPVSVTAAIKPVHTLELDHSASNNDPDASSAYVNPFERSAEQSPFKKMRKQVEQDLEVVEVADVPKESEMEAEPARDVQQKDDNEEDADETVAASTRVEVGSAIDDEQHGEDNLGEMEIHIDSDSDDSE